MQINDLLIFQAVAEQGSFTKAAAATNTVQSNVTARVKSLEKEFDTVLFERTSRSITLTASGVELLKASREILLLINKAKDAIHHQTDTIRGTIRIGCIHTTAALRVPGILQTFGETFPDVEFRLKSGTSAGLIKEVLNAQLDGAFVAGDVTDDRLLIQPIVTEDLCVVTSALVPNFDHLKQSRKRLKLIVFDDGCSYRRHFENIIQDWQYNKVSLVEMDTLEAILNAVENNIGVTLLPVELIERHYKHKALKTFNPPPGSAQMRINFVKRKDRTMSEAYQKFFQLLADGYRTSSIVKL